MIKGITAKMVRGIGFQFGLGLIQAFLFFTGIIYAGRWFYVHVL